MLTEMAKRPRGSSTRCWKERSGNGTIRLHSRDLFQGGSVKLRAICLLLSFIIEAGLRQGILWPQTDPAVAILDSANTQHYCERNHPISSAPASYHRRAAEYQ